MAEAVTKANMFSQCSTSGIGGIHHHHLHHQQHRISLIPTKSSINSSAIGFPSLKVGSLTTLRLSSSSSSSSSYSGIFGSRVCFGGQQGIPNGGNNFQAAVANVQMSIGIGKASKWWEKGLQQNMKEVNGAQDLVDSLLNAGDKLVVVDFFSPGCGGCKALHPKICQLAEMNPDVQFLQVNYEEHKSMCYSLNVHVLPFFRFYRGAQGRLCSFSCTNATIKKFKDALAKHSPDRCSLVPTKGLEEKELLALAANKDLSFKYPPKPEQPALVPAQEQILAEVAAASTPYSNSVLGLPLPLPLPLPSTSLETTQDSKEKTFVSSGR